MPSLAVLALTDSLSEIWRDLARECDIDLQMLAQPSDFDRLVDAVAIVSAAGDERRLEETLLEVIVGDLDVAAVGALPDHHLAASVVRVGASAYFALPEDYDLLRSWLREKTARVRSRASREEFAKSQHDKYDFAGILGDSPALRAALDRAARVIPHKDVTVLLTGDTGTGKELVARAIHYNGPRHQAPFVDVNCAAIPEQLLESELFGHEKGSFTGATAAKPGLFELADGGTLFLDEIGHLALPLQGKVLRAIEQRQVRHVGGARNIPVDVRIIAATHVNLRDAVREGTFREDLYYRLNVVPIELPALLERRADIVPLAEHFLATFSAHHRMPPPRLSREAQDALRSYDWPGNVRELRNAMERALLLSPKPVLDPADLALGALSGTSRREALPFPATVDEIVHAAAVRMLDVMGGNKSHAAKRLGISRSRLQRLLDGATLGDEPSVTKDQLVDDDHKEKV